MRLLESHIHKDRKMVVTGGGEEGVWGDFWLMSPGFQVCQMKRVLEIDGHTMM